MTPIRALAVLVLAGAAVVLPAHAAIAMEQADPLTADPIYCVYQNAITAFGITFYPGGRYCVPGP